MTSFVNEKKNRLNSTIPNENIYYGYSLEVQLELKQCIQLAQTTGTKTMNAHTFAVSENVRVKFMAQVVCR